MFWLAGRTQKANCATETAARRYILSRFIPSYGSTAAQRHDIGELTCFRRGGFQYSAACGDNLVEALRGKGPEVAVDVDEACHPDPDLAITLIRPLPPLDVAV